MTEITVQSRLVDDDVAERLRSLRVRTKRRRPIVQELTSRMPSDRIAAVLAELERAFDPMFDSTAAMESFAQELRTNRDRALRRSEGREPPADVLLATSMLQVGVDVARLGLMVVTGQPKNTAEYIQATSRIGRDRERPGVVFTIYQWARPRDLAYYEDFIHYHQTFASRVEGLTTTPFSDRALDRGLSCVLVTYLRHSSPAALANDAAGCVDTAIGSPVVATMTDGVSARATRVLNDLTAADDVRKRVRYRLDTWAARRSRVQAGMLGYETAPDVTGLLHAPEEGEWDLYTVPRSMREVEPEVLLQLEAGDRSLESGPAWEYRLEVTE